MSHYETLDVERDATAEQIRAAFRKASAKAHPDREGGSHEAQAAINAAYRILSDPVARKHYDETGEEEKETPMQRAYQVVDEAIAHCARAEVRDPLKASRGGIRDAMDKAMAEVSRLEKRRAWLFLQRKRISTKRTLDVIGFRMEQDTKAAEREIRAAREYIQACTMAIAILDEYTFKGEPEPEVPPGVQPQLDGLKALRASFAQAYSTTSTTT